MVGGQVPSQETFQTHGVHVVQPSVLPHTEDVKTVWS